MVGCGVGAVTALLVVGLATAAPGGELLEAVKANDLARVQEAVGRGGADINARDESGRTALYWAALGGRLPILAYLVAHGADAGVRDSRGTAPLHVLASRGDDAGVTALLDAGADVDVRSANRQTPLHLAALRGHLETMRLLVGRKADLECRDDRGRTPLVVAGREMAGVEVVRSLLDLGADIDAADSSGDTTLTLAAWRGSTDVVALLLARRATVPTTGRQGRALLERSVEKGLAGLFGRLLERGVDLDLETGHGGTLLHAAAAGGSPAIIEALIAREMSVGARDTFGWTPLHFAVDMGRTAAIELLLAHGAELDARTLIGQTPYNLAEDNSDAETIALLTSKGAKTDPPAFPTLTGEYLGQRRPGRKAALFAPGIVSGRYGLHSNIAFSPDGTEAYWSMMIPARTEAYGTDRTVVSRLVDGRWTYPRAAVLDGTKVEDVPFFQPGTGALHDMARRPVEGEQEGGRERIWVWQKGPTGWSPRPLPSEVNDVPQHWQFSLDRAGNVYFATTIADSLGGSDVYVCRLVGGRYQPPENLGPAVNSPEGEGFPFISADGQTLLFGRDMDIWASFRDPAGRWTRARRLGPEVNTRDMEVLPVLSHDGTLLFFSRGYATYWIDAAVVAEQRGIALSRVGKSSAAEEIGPILRTGDVELAKTRFAAMRGSEEAGYFVDESELNALGYALLRERKLQEAVAAFEMNTEAFPDSWNVWDSLGEAVLHSGDDARAAAYYERSVALNPGNENGTNALSRLRGYALDRELETREPAAFAPGQGTGLSGPYLGQTPPGLEPVVFAPGIVSTAGAFEFSQTFTPDGREIYFTRRVEPGGENAILVSRLERDGWSAPEVAPFSAGFPSNEPFVTPDGSRLYFGSNRPRREGAAAEHGIWVVERTAGGWGEPRYHGEGMYVSAARTGNLYLTDITRTAGGGAIVYPWSASGPGAPRRLTGGVNEPRPADHAFIAPDESYVLLDSYFRPGGQGGEGDLWVSFRMPDGSWSEALNLGDAVNTPATNFCPAVSPDGRYIFFSTHRDIYWVSARVLEPLRARVMGAAEPR